MNKKLLVSLFLSSLFLLPVAANAATLGSANAITPQIRLQIGQTRRHRGWVRGRHLGWYRNRRDRDMDRDEVRYNRMARNGYRPGYVQQVYYLNGRRYVRWVRRY